jgi:3-methyl-2-oxobutanoate hydroxymethyltransferase
MNSIPPLSPSSDSRPLTTHDIRAKKGVEQIVSVTAYDAMFGRLVDEAGVDLILVGDSLGNVVAGYDSTLPVTLDQMIYHAAAVRRGVSRALLAVDMPFLTYQIDVSHALENGGRILQQTGAQAVKVEGGTQRIADVISMMVEIGIPVMGHLGFTPQSVNTLGGYRVQGRDASTAQRLIDEAKRIEQSGAFCIVLELIPAGVAEQITKAVSIPTIGIGAGAGCDGQILVLPDLLGLNDSFTPKFLKRYAALAGTVRSALQTYAEEVRNGTYPDVEHSF